MWRSVLTQPIGTGAHWSLGPWWRALQLQLARAALFHCSMTTYVGRWYCLQTLTGIYSMIINILCADRLEYAFIRSEVLVSAQRRTFRLQHACRASMRCHTCAMDNGLQQIDSKSHMAAKQLKRPFDVGLVEECAAPGAALWASPFYVLAFSRFHFFYYDTEKLYPLVVATCDIVPTAAE